jgi:hypothetical protein
MKSELKAELGRIASRLRATPKAERGPLLERYRELCDKLTLIEIDDKDRAKQEHRTAYESGMPYSSYNEREPLDVSKVHVEGGTMKRRFTAP